MNFALDRPSATAGAVTLRLAPLDVPLNVEHVEVPPDTIGAACRGWEGVASSPTVPLRLKVEPSPALSGTGHVEIGFDGIRMTVLGSGVSGRADVGHGSAECAISAEYLKDPVVLRREVLEPLVLMLLTHRDRTPVHASAFIVDGLAILLAGRTGAGKSCLARAADSLGFQVLAEDTVFVQLAPRLKVWGWPSVAHLLASDAPDAAGPTRLRGGKVKHVVPLRSSSRTAIACDRAVLCLLSPPCDGAPSLSRVSAAAVEERLWPLDEGFDLLPGPIARAVAALSAGGAWDLRLSADPAEAVRLLAANVPRLVRISSIPLP
jgi:hypothetical protein